MNSKLLKDRNFFFFISGGMITILGDEILMFVLALYVLTLTGSAAKYGSVIAIGGIPMILLGPFAGAIVDRFNKRKLLILLDLLNGTLLILFFILSLKTSPSVNQIYFLVLISGINNSFYTAAAQSVVFGLVEKKDLIQANSLFSLSIQIARILAPAISVIIYRVQGISLIFLLDSLTFFTTSIIMLKLIVIKEDENVNMKKNIFQNIIDGLKLYKRKDILNISISGMLTYMLVIPIYIVGIPYLIKNIFNGTDLSYGTVQTVYSVGTLLAFLSLPFIGKYVKGLKAQNASMVGMLMSVLILFLLSNYAFYNLLRGSNILMILFFSIFSFLFALSFSSYTVFYTTFCQQKVGFQFLGRFYSMLTMLFGIGRVLGNEIYGSLFDKKIFFYPVLLVCLGILIKILMNIFINPNEEASYNTVEVKKNLVKLEN